MQNPYIPLHFVRNLNIPLHAGLGTAFFCVRHATFFCILLKNATFFFAFFSNFWRLMKPKRTLRSFAFYLKECALFQKNAHSFLTLKKNLNVLFPNFLRLMKPNRMLQSFAFYLKERGFFQKNERSFLTLKKNLNVFFSNFLWLMKPKKNFAFFLRECVFFKKNTCSFWVSKVAKKFEKNIQVLFF